MSWGSAFGEIILSNFITATETPYSSPCKYDYPNDVPLGQKPCTMTVRIYVTMIYDNSGCDFFGSYTKIHKFKKAHCGTVPIGWCLLCFFVWFIGGMGHTCANTQMHK